MSYLQKIKKGNADLPPRVVAAGPEGIGKSTFAANAPEPLFIAAEDGLTGLEHVDRFTPSTFDELKKFLDEIEGSAEIAFRTLAIDTADWLERMIHAHLCKAGGVKFIEDYAKGFGKGYAAASAELVSLLAQLDRIRHKHKVSVIILSHVQIKSHTPPGSDPYDRYEMKGHKGFTGILREWPDACLFMVYETFLTKEKGGNEKVIGGERIMRTIWAPGWDAKNRYNLPDPIPLDKDRGYSALLDLIAEHRGAPQKQQTAEELRDRIRTLAPLAGFEDDEAKARFQAWFDKLETHPIDQLKAGLKSLEEKVN